MNQHDWKIEDYNGRRLATHPIIKSYASKRISHLKKFVAHSGTCLELGAGDGFFSLQLEKHYQLLATDQHREALENNPSLAEKEVVDAHKINKPEQSFDLVFEANMLHHSDDENKILQEMARVSKERIVLIEPNPLHPLTIILAMILPHERKSLLFTKKYFKKLAHQNGLKIVSFARFGMLPPNKSPNFLWKFFYFLDNKIPLFGLENIVVLEKN